MSMLPLYGLSDLPKNFFVADFVQTILPGKLNVSTFLYKSTYFWSLWATAISTLSVDRSVVRPIPRIV